MITRNPSKIVWIQLLHHLTDFVGDSLGQHLLDAEQQIIIVINSNGRHHLCAPKHVVDLGEFLCGRNGEGGGDGGGQGGVARHVLMRIGSLTM
jgi:hypothetical protein